MFVQRVLAACSTLASFLSTTVTTPALLPTADWTRIPILVRGYYPSVSRTLISDVLRVENEADVLPYAVPLGRHVWRSIVRARGWDEASSSVVRGQTHDDMYDGHSALSYSCIPPPSVRTLPAPTPLLGLPASPLFLTLPAPRRLLTLPAPAVVPILTLPGRRAYPTLSPPGPFLLLSAHAFEWPRLMASLTLDACFGCESKIVFPDPPVSLREAIADSANGSGQRLLTPAKLLPEVSEYAVAAVIILVVLYSLAFDLIWHLLSEDNIGCTVASVQHLLDGTGVSMDLASYVPGARDPLADYQDEVDRMVGPLEAPQAESTRTLGRSVEPEQPLDKEVSNLPPPSSPASLPASDPSQSPTSPAPPTLSVASVPSTPTTPATSSAWTTSCAPAISPAPAAPLAAIATSASATTPIAATAAPTASAPATSAPSTLGTLFIPVDPSPRDEGLDSGSSAQPGSMAVTPEAQELPIWAEPKVSLGLGTAPVSLGPQPDSSRSGCTEPQQKPNVARQPVAIPEPAGLKVFRLNIGSSSSAAVKKVKPTEAIAAPKPTPPKPNKPRPRRETPQFGWPEVYMTLKWTDHGSDWTERTLDEIALAGATAPPPAPPAPAPASMEPEPETEPEPTPTPSSPRPARALAPTPIPTSSPAPTPEQAHTANRRPQPPVSRPPAWRSGVPFSQWVAQSTRMAPALPTVQSLPPLPPAPTSTSTQTRARPWIPGASTSRWAPKAVLQGGSEPTVAHNGPAGSNEGRRDYGRTVGTNGEGRDGRTGARAGTGARDGRTKASRIQDRPELVSGGSGSRGRRVGSGAGGDGSGERGGRRDEAPSSPHWFAQRRIRQKRRHA